MKRYDKRGNISAFVMVVLVVCAYFVGEMAGNKAGFAAGKLESEETGFAAGEAKGVETGRTFEKGIATQAIKQMIPIIYRKGFNAGSQHGWDKCMSIPEGGELFPDKERT